VCFIGFEMLIFKVVPHVAARESLVRLVIVFDVIGAKALVGIVDVDVVVGDKETALAPLRAVSGKLGDAALGNRRADLLGSAGIRAGENRSERKHRYRQEKLKRGKVPSMRVAIHADEVVKGVSPIA
jgi:hypothetical protein